MFGFNRFYNQSVIRQLAPWSPLPAVRSLSPAHLDVRTVNSVHNPNALLSLYCAVLPYDIRDFDENAAAFQKIIETFGTIDVLVANAARVYGAPAADDDFAKIKQLFDINYFAHLFTTKIGKRFSGFLLRTSTL